MEPLPYSEWEPTKTTIHLWSQIVGKIALACAPHLNHWWAIRLQPSPRGLTTHLLRHGDAYFRIAFDLLDHRLVLTTNRLHEPLSFSLHDGLSVATFYEQLFELLRSAGIDQRILAKPYGVPITTPFARDEEHRTYDAVMARRWWRIVAWSSDVFQSFASSFAGKQSEPELFWHSFDLAMGRYSGKRAPGPPKSDKVAQEAYSHEVIAFGFWAGDANVPAPTYYTYTAPEPAGLTDEALQPVAASWASSGAGHLGQLPFEAVRSSDDPRAALLLFLESAYRAGARAASWDTSLYAR